MIIVGYPGIGKSTVASRSWRHIDLESSIFWIDGKKWSNWYEIYVRRAVEMSKAGYYVFVSAHKVVRDELRKVDCSVIEVFPALELKDEWVQRLLDRYEKSSLDKDKRAWVKTLANYEGNIKDMMKEPFDKIILNSMEYDLEKDLDKYIMEHFVCEAE